MDSEAARPGFAVTVIRWAARAVGIPPTAVIVFFFAAHAFAEEEEMHLASAADFVAIGSIAFMALAFLVAWIWEGPAGGALLAGYVSFAFAQGRLVPSPFYLFFPALGLVFLWCDQQSRKSRRPGKAETRSV
jgi:hypothetical protein